MNKKLCIFYLVILALVNAQTDSCCRNYQIQVTGKGIASAQPDVAILNINFSEQGLTSAEAVKSLATRSTKPLQSLGPMDMETMPMKLAHLTFTQNMIIL